MNASVNLIRILQHQFLIYASVNHNKNLATPPVLSSKERLIKESTDFTCCEEVGLRIFSILSISFNVLILDRYRRSSRKAVLNLSLIVQYKKKCASSSTTQHFSTRISLHLHYCTGTQNCCQIFCDLLLKSAFERIFNVMQLILVKIIKMRACLPQHPWLFIFSSRGHDRQSSEQNNRKLISLHNNGEDDKQIISPKEFKSWVTCTSLALLYGKTELSAVKYFVICSQNLLLSGFLMLCSW
jgi:hypothetical protein